MSDERRYHAEANRRFFQPARPGETTRKCLVCGREYEPRSRTQKYCDGCRKR